MTTLKDELRNLAERVENATGPDRELDMLVWIVRHGELDNDRIEGSRGSRLIRRGGTRGGVCHPVGKVVALEHQALVPSYTASLDAAMTLADGFGGQVTFFKDGTAKAYLWQPYPLAISAKAATPALALTAAALRARASIKGSSDATD